MATCPTCGGFLDRDHHCQALWRLYVRYWANVLFGGLCAGIIGFGVLAVLDAHVSILAVGLSTLLGIIITNAFLRGAP